MWKQKRTEGQHMTDGLDASGEDHQLSTEIWSGLQSQSCGGYVYNEWKTCGCLCSGQSWILCALQCTLPERILAASVKSVPEAAGFFLFHKSFMSSCWACMFTTNGSKFRASERLGTPEGHAVILHELCEELQDQPFLTPNMPNTAAWSVPLDSLL